jgi:cytochrome c oxidase cbb3-type subunit 2
MNGFVIFIGLFCAMSLSWYGIILKNYQDFNRQQPQKLLMGGNYPGGRSGTANQGQQVYKANGCAACHTMQVRANMDRTTSDFQRGWGRRNTVLQDFLYDQNVMLGQVRIGPDLADVGTRLPDRNYQLLHLYNPRITTSGSLMPQFPYLFQKRKIGTMPSPNALNLSGEYAPEKGYEIVPTHEAEALVTYITSLHASEGIFEAPIYPPPPPPSTNEVQSAAANTNNSPAPANNAK